jgi:hypothetical protein
MRVMRGFGGYRLRRIGIGLTWLAIAFTFAQFADLLTSLAVAHELNPVAKGVAGQPMVGVALKTSLIAFVVATSSIVDPQRPRVARLVLVVGIMAGLFGALSNSSLTPFHVA